MPSFRLTPDKPYYNSIGIISLENDVGRFNCELRITIRESKYAINGDLRIALEEFKSNGYKYSWVQIDLIYIRRFDILNNPDGWKSSLTWVAPTSSKLASATTPYHMINFVITMIDSGLDFKEIKTFYDKDPEVKELGCLLNKFNLLVIKKMIEKRRKE